MRQSGRLMFQFAEVAVPGALGIAPQQQGAYRHDHQAAEGYSRQPDYNSGAQHGTGLVGCYETSSGAR